MKKISELKITYKQFRQRLYKTDNIIIIKLMIPRLSNKILGFKELKKFTGLISFIYKIEEKDYSQVKNLKVIISDCIDSLLQSGKKNNFKISEKDIELLTPKSSNLSLEYYKKYYDNKKDSKNPDLIDKETIIDGIAIKSENIYKIIYDKGKINPVLEKKINNVDVFMDYINEIVIPELKDSSDYDGSISDYFYKKYENIIIEKLLNHIDDKDDEEETEINFGIKFKIDERLIKKISEMMEELEEPPRKKLEINLINYFYDNDFNQDKETFYFNMSEYVSFLFKFYREKNLKTEDIQKKIETTHENIFNLFLKDKKQLIYYIKTFDYPYKNLENILLKAYESNEIPIGHIYSYIKMIHEYYETKQHSNDQILKILSNEYSKFENIISRNHKLSLLYIRDVIKSPWKGMENFAETPEQAYVLLNEFYSKQKISIKEFENKIENDFQILDEIILKSFKPVTIHYLKKFRLSKIPNDIPNNFNLSVNKKLLENFLTLIFNRNKNSDFIELLKKYPNFFKFYSNYEYKDFLFNFMINKFFKIKLNEENLKELKKFSSLYSYYIIKMNMGRVIGLNKKVKLESIEKVFKNEIEEILKDPETTYEFVKTFNITNWSEGEKTIQRSLFYSILYSLVVAKRDFIRENKMMFNNDFLKKVYDSYIFNKRSFDDEMVLKKDILEAMEDISFRFSEVSDGSLFRDAFIDIEEHLIPIQLV